MKKQLSNPLLHFLLIGVGIFILYGWLRKDESGKHEILIDDEHVKRTISIFRQEWGREPGQEELLGLVQNLIRQEVYYRQALEMNLDHNDELIKRRMVQKLSFITHDLATLQQPSEDSLKFFYSKHRHKYLVDASISFDQVYFNPDKRKAPLVDAEQLLKRIRRASLKQDLIMGYGDPLPLATNILNANRRQLKEQMGQAFADTVFSLSTGSWHGPILSGYGVHLVFVHVSTNPKEPTWTEIRADVLRDFQYAEMERLNETVYAGFRKNYEVRLSIKDSALNRYRLAEKLGADETH